MKTTTAFLFFFFVWLSAICALGQGVRVGPDDKVVESTLSLPYAFYNESFGFAVGYVYGVVGRPQKQATLLTTVIAGSKGSAMGFLVGRDLQMPKVERLFLDPVVSVGYFKDNEAYINGNPDFPDERAGSNDSDEDNYVKGDGWDNFFRLRFKYLLPMGHGRNKIISTYKIKEGLLESGVTGGTSLNPFRSGKSYLETRPFYRWQQIDGDDVDDDIKTNGLDFSVFWDNRDFYANPSRGFGLRGKLSRDFGWFDSSNSWTNVEGELDWYIPFRLGSWLRQGVIALDYWTSYSPTWDEQSDGTIDNRPPAYTGSTLGGLWRMRGYPSQRFNDKAAVYYSAELRLIPRWNPFERWHWIQKYVGIQWLQFVPFVEVGRVAPEWSFNRLHSDMKWDAGLGIRAWAKGIVARIDAAYSEEGFGVQMMISQPFQF
ncbi:MAG: BamA/TamA family outer membrane protein [Desulfobacterales bacterium]|nr:MAG: BamA/TamA family outer membrane protein [Desulfobacterales bacterium]